MKDSDFHIPFLHGMIVIGIVTILSMLFAHHFISEKYFPSQKSAVFTSSESHNSSESQ